MTRSDPSGGVARVFDVVGIAGSLRRGSYNRALLRAATELSGCTTGRDKWLARFLLPQGTRRGMDER